MKYLLISFLVLSLSFGGSGEDSSNLDIQIQRAIRKHGEHFNTVLRMIAAGESINDVLRPLSFLGCGGVGFVFKGIRLQDSLTVAIKFVAEKGMDKAKREYEMYSYLNAINNTQAEKYGIPTVFYYGHWKGFIVTAYTELEKSLKDHYDSESYGYLISDVLFLMKQFIKQSKYIHSHGIRHDDIKPENILTRGCASYLIDFDLASKMVEENSGRTLLFASLRRHRHIKRVATDDWESFLYTICELVGIRLDWFNKDLTHRVKNPEEAMQLLFMLKSNRKRIFKAIERSEHDILRPILLAFAYEALSKKPLPDYDGLNRLVTRALKHYFPEKICFSWIGKQIKNGTMADNNSNEIMINESVRRAFTSISDLVIPDDFNQYKVFEYPIVDEEFFEKKESKQLFDSVSQCPRI